MTSYTCFNRCVVLHHTAIMLAAILAVAMHADADKIEISLEGVWVEDPAGQPVIDKGPKGAWDHAAVDNPFLYVENGVFYCFYEGENVQRQEQTGLAISTDLLHWEKYEGNPIVPAGPPGAWDYRAAKIPIVAKHDDIYVLLYTGKDRDGATNAAIGVATSKDLRHWQKSADNPIIPGRPGKWDPILTTCPTIIKKDGLYYTIYRGMTGFYENQRLGLATSTDLLRWTRPDEPLQGLDGIYSFATCPLLINGEYVALGQSRPPKHFYLSTDLITWRQGAAIKASVGHIETPSQPVLVDGTLWILYEGETGDRIYRARFVPKP